MKKFIITLAVLLVLGMTVRIFTHSGPTPASDIALKQLTIKTEMQGATGQGGTMQVELTITNPTDKDFSGNIRISSLGPDKEPIDFDTISLENLRADATTKKLTWLKVAIVPQFVVKANDGYFE